MSEEFQSPCPASASFPADRAIALESLGPYCRHLICSSNSSLHSLLAITGIQSLRARRVCGQAVHRQPVRCRKGTATSGIYFICSLGLFQLVEWKELICVPYLSDKGLKLVSTIHIGGIFCPFHMLELGLFPSVPVFWDTNSSPRVSVTKISFSIEAKLRYSEIAFSINKVL